MVLSACEAGAGGLGLDIDEYAGLPAALQLAGAGSVIATLWPVSDPLTALQVDLLYELLTAQRDAVGDLPRVVRTVGERVRVMDVAEARTRLDRLRAATSDPLARVALEAFGARLAERGPRPFEHPYDWATFLRQRLQTGDRKARAELERVGLTESDLCTAWHHLPRARRGWIAEALRRVRRSG